MSITSDLEFSEIKMLEKERISSNTAINGIVWNHT